MKNFIWLLVALLFSSSVYSHPGRTNSNGCHTCRTDYCRGEYHCHNGSGSRNTVINDKYKDFSNDNILYTNNLVSDDKNDKKEKNYFSNILLLILIIYITSKVEIKKTFSFIKKIVGKSLSSIYKVKIKVINFLGFDKKLSRTNFFYIWIFSTLLLTTSKKIVKDGNVEIGLLGLYVFFMMIPVLIMATVRRLNYLNYNGPLIVTVIVVIAIIISIFNDFSLGVTGLVIYQFIFYFGIFPLALTEKRKVKSEGVMSDNTKEEKKICTKKTKYRIKK